MADQWYYARDDDKHGPVSTAQLKELARNGDLAHSDLVWRDGISEWTPARRINGLFPSQVGPPPIPGRSSPPSLPRSTTAAQVRDEDVEEAERVGFGPRLGAFLIDSVVCVVAVIVLALVAGLVAAVGLGARNAAEGQIVGSIAGGIVGSLTVILYWLWEGITGAAAGKLALGLVIANENGTPAPTGVLFKRYWFKTGIASVLLPILAVVTKSEIYEVTGSLWALAVVIGCFVVLGEKRQAFHDMIAHTAVYRKADIAEVAPPSAAFG